MSDDSFANTLSLSLRRAEALKMVKSDKAPLKFKTKVRGVAVRSCGGNVVEQAGQGPCFKEGSFVRLDPGREVLGYDCMTCQ